MLTTLRFEKPDRPPHFEVMFELEKEAFGLAFPDRHAWAGCSRAEKDRMIGQCMAIYEKIVERYHWDALAVFWPPQEAIRKSARYTLARRMAAATVTALDSPGHSNRKETTL